MIFVNLLVSRAPPPATRGGSEDPDSHHFEVVWMDVEPALAAMRAGGEVGSEARL